MASTLYNVAFDCADPYGLAQFWSQVFGCSVDSEYQPGDVEVDFQLANGSRLYFQQVPESKSVKNRVHVCLQPEDTREAEVQRLLGLGATLLHDHREPGGLGWVVLADPEGNEFCVLRGAAQRQPLTPDTLQ